MSFRDRLIATLLLAEGFRADDAGAGLAHARRIVWITEIRAASLAEPKLAMHLDAAMLAAACLALVPFSGAES